jgi:hypothetical protein
MTDIGVFEAYDGFTEQKYWYSIDLARTLRLTYSSFSSCHNDLKVRGCLDDPYTITVYPHLKTASQITNDSDWAIALLTYE